MSAKPVFFIVTPSFQQGQFIKQTLRSIGNQAGVEVRSIVFDGGSRDSTLKVLKSFGKKIWWRSEPDKGQSDALNKGWRRSFQLAQQLRGRSVYIAYLNSDDYYAPDVFAEVHAAFAADPYRAWLVGDAQIVDGQGRPIQAIIKLYKQVGRWLLSWPLLCILNPIPQPAVFMRLRAAQEVGLFNRELRYTMDYEYWLRLWRRFGRPIVVPQLLANFRIHDSSKGSTSFSAQFQEQFQVTQRFTRNPAWLFIQKLHNEAIMAVYTRIR